MSGEPYALRGARTVRRGEAGKQLDCAPSLTLHHCKMRISKALEAAGVKEFEVSVEEKRVTAEAEDAA